MAFRFLAVGEVLWDLLPTGRQLGGAPANVAFHARALGAEARLVSRVGRDPLGREILDRLAAAGLPTDTVEVDPQTPTGTVTVELGPDGQPRFTIVENVAWDRIEADATARAAAVAADAVCFGSLAQRCPGAREAIRTLVAAAHPGALRVFDVNLRPPFVDRAIVEDSLRLAGVLKLNDQELPVLAGMFDIGGAVREQLEGLAGRFGLTTVALTRGAAGSLLYHKGEWSDHPGERPPVVRDTVGAGDAFTAVLVVGLLEGRPLDAINRRANRVAAFVCSQPGATPALPPGLLAD